MTEPVQCFDSTVPPGKAILWVKNESGQQVSALWLYESYEDALADAGNQLLKHKGRSVTINYKTPDENFLDVWVLERKAHYPKGKPFSEVLGGWVAAAKDAFKKVKK